jgi:hypothetical protein
VAQTLHRLLSKQPASGFARAVQDVGAGGGGGGGGAGEVDSAAKGKALAAALVPGGNAAAALAVYLPVVRSTAGRGQREAARSSCCSCSLQLQQLLLQKT